MLGTLSAAERPRQTVLNNSFSTECGQTVETMCTVAGCFVDQRRHRVLGKRGLCGNLYDNWSDLLCLAIYVPVSSSDSGLTHEPPDSAEANRRFTYVAVALHGLLLERTATKLC